MLKRKQIPVTAYTIKVWLTAVLIAPAVYIGTVVYHDPHHDLTSLVSYPAFVLIELFCSGPAWLALYLVTRVLAPHVPGKILFKMILTVAGIGLTILTFTGFDWFWDFKPEDGISEWMWGNALLIVAAIWVFKFPRPVQLTCNSTTSHKQNDN